MMRFYNSYNTQQMMNMEHWLKGTYLLSYFM